MTLRKLMETIAEFNIPLNTEVFLKDNDDFVFQVGANEIEHGYDDNSSYIILSPRTKPVDEGNLHRIARKAIADDRNQTLEHHGVDGGGDFVNDVAGVYGNKKDQTVNVSVEFNNDELEALGIKP